MSTVSNNVSWCRNLGLDVMHVSQGIRYLYEELFGAVLKEVRGIYVRAEADSTPPALSLDHPHPKAHIGASFFLNLTLCALV